MSIKFDPLAKPRNMQHANAEQVPPIFFSREEREGTRRLNYKRFCCKIYYEG
jgi:hypothetical protein